MKRNSYFSLLTAIILSCIFSLTAIAETCLPVTSLEGGYSGGLRRQGLKQVGDAVYCFGLAHLYRSTDNGDNWSIYEPGGMHAITDLTATGDALFSINMESGNNILRSFDGGLTWAMPDLTGLPGSGGQGKSFARTIFCIEAVGDVLFAFVRDNVNMRGRIKLYKSVDNGDTWTVFSTLNYEGEFVDDYEYIAECTLRNDGGRLFARLGADLVISLDKGESVEYHYQIVGGIKPQFAIMGNSVIYTDALFKMHSMDIESGEIYDIDMPGENDYFALAVSRLNDNRLVSRVLFTGAQKSTYMVSQDGGMTWGEQPSYNIGNNAGYFPILLTDEGSLLAAGMNGIWKSNHADFSFHESTAGFRSFGSDDLSSVSGIYFSGGSLVTVDNAGLPADAFGMSLQDISIGMYTADADGGTWTNDYPGLTAKYDGHYFETVFYCRDQLLWPDEYVIKESVDGGMSWQENGLMDFPPFGLNLFTLFASDGDNTIIAAHYDETVAEEKTIYFKKEADLWVRWESELPGSGLNAQVMKGDTVLLKDAENRFFASYDFGSSWQQISVELPEGYDLGSSMALSAMTEAGGSVFLFQEIEKGGEPDNDLRLRSGIFRFENGEFRLMGLIGDTDMPGRNMDVLDIIRSFKGYDGVLYLGTAGGFWRSDNLGETFETMALDGFPASGSVVSITASPDWIYLLGNGSGVWKIAREGTSVTAEEMIMEPYLYPNPADGVFELSGGALEGVYDLSGKEYKLRSIGSGRYGIEDLPPGAYTARVLHEKRTVSVKLIKK